MYGTYIQQYIMSIIQVVELNKQRERVSKPNRYTRSTNVNTHTGIYKTYILP